MHDEEYYQGSMDLLHSMFERLEAQNTEMRQTDLDLESINVEPTELYKLCAKLGKVNHSLTDFAGNKKISNGTKYPKEIEEYNKVSRQATSLYVEAKQLQNQFDEYKARRIDQENTLSTLSKNRNDEQSNT